VLPAGKGKKTSAMEYQLDASQVHYRWDRSLEPRLRIVSGDTVVVQTREAAEGFFTWTSTAQDVSRRAFKGHPLSGPIFVDDAGPGDALEIAILDLKPGEIGRTTSRSGGGLLGEDFTEPYLKVWDLSNGQTAVFRPGIEIPIEPFLGVMGVAPAEPGEHLTSPPRRVGGNMDVKQLTIGTSLYLPVEVEGALFSAGDGHAAQGDGEVCGTAIETSMTARLRFTLHHDMPLSTPRFRTSGPLALRTNRGAWYGTSGVAPDLWAATQQAVREMVAHLTATYGLEPLEAYALCSVAVDLKIAEVVDAPNWVVTALLPLSIFKAGKDPAP
jgi:acetamidase/formamidase